MKKKDLIELRAKEVKEIKEILSKKKLELATAKKGKNLRKDIAQILTVIKEKELIEEMKGEEK